MTRHRTRATRPRRTRRLRAVAFVIAATLATAAVADGGQVRAQSADDVAVQILAVQAEADRLAERWTRLDTEAQALTEQVSAATERADQAAADLAAVDNEMTRSAIARYTTDALAPAILPVSDDVMDSVETTALASFAMGTAVADIDAYAAVRATAQARAGELAEVQRRNDDNRAALAETRQQLDQQLIDLRDLESELRDDEIRRAYQARRAAQLAELATATTGSSQPAQAARGEASPPTATTPPMTNKPPATTTTATTGAARPATTSQPNDAPPTTDPATDTPAKTSPVTDAPRATGLACPIAGPNAFSNTWGDSRSGGRSHEGVDMMSPLGTPVVAVTDGAATMKTNTLGGITVGLNGTDGNYYYFAHLSAWEGSSRSVRQGEVIGYVGHTGNTTADHLHFGIYPDGGAAINPYPTVRPIC